MTEGLSGAGGTALPPDDLRAGVTEKTEGPLESQRDCKADQASTLFGQD